MDQDWDLLGKLKSSCWWCRSAEDNRKALQGTCKKPHLLPHAPPPQPSPKLLTNISKLKGTTTVQWPSREQEDLSGLGSYTEGKKRPSTSGKGPGVHKIPKANLRYKEAHLPQEIERQICT